MTEDRPGGHGPEFHSARTGDAIPGATVARLPVYLRAVVAERDAGASTISSDRLGGWCLSGWPEGWAGWWGWL